MSAFSNYLEDALINAVLRNSAYSSPATVYVALFTTAPGEDASGTELSGNGYTRQSAAFTAPTSGATSNNADVSFTASGGNWGTVTHFALFDAASNGNMLFHGALGQSRDVLDGETLTIATGDLDITLD